MNSSPDDLLNFRDFTPVHGSSNRNQVPAQISVNSPEKSSKHGAQDPLQDLINDMTNSVQAMGEPIGAQSSPTATNTDGTNARLSFLTIEYYQQFFNVDTIMVIDRIVSSMIPKRAPGNYLRSHIGLNPDLYGPFWIIITLIFSIAISGNIASYLQHASENFHWHYNFHLVSYAATSIFIYSTFIPGALWGLLKWSLKPVEDDVESENASYTPSLLSLMCVYGYSLAIYIPVSILWVIQFSLIQWILVITAGFLSGSVLIAVLTPALRNSKISFFLMIGIISAHFLLATGFMLFFFHVPGSSNLVMEPLKVAEVVTQLAINKTV